MFLEDAITVDLTQVQETVADIRDVNRINLYFLHYSYTTSKGRGKTIKQTQKH